MTLFDSYDIPPLQISAAMKNIRKFSKIVNFTTADLVWSEMNVTFHAHE